MASTTGAEIARAYVLVVPSTQGAQKRLTEELVPEAEIASEKAGHAGGEKFKSAMGVAAKAAAAAMAAAIAGAAALIKSSISAYADTEQLTGGIEKLYGDASQQVIQAASQAYKTAGVSANAYLQSVTGISAALLKSGVSAEEAAALADRAMRDMADNANTFGTKSAEELSLVYQALARGNYTLLDNLSLGYGGSKQGMEELIKDANAYAKATGRAADLTIDNFADIVTAIGLVQEKTNIAGTTAKEAEGTISGSLAMLSASWQNFIAGLGDPNADLDALVSNVIGSFQAVSTNVLPTVKRIADGLVKALPDLVKQVAEFLPTLLPTVLEAVVTLATSLAEMLPDVLESIVQVIVDNAEMLIGAAIDVANAIIEAVPRILDVLSPAIPGIIEKLIKVILDPKNLETWVNAAMDIATNIVENLPDIIQTIADALPAQIEKLAAYVQTDEAKEAFRNSGKALAGAIWEGIKAIIPSNWWTYLLPGGGGFLRDTQYLFSDASNTSSYSGAQLDLGGYDWASAQGGSTTIYTGDVSVTANSAAAFASSLRAAASLAG